MAVIKRKPTSPGRRFVVSVVTPDLHKGAPYAPLWRRRNEPVAATAVVALPCVTLVVVTSSTTVLLTLSATKMVSLQRLSVWNMIQTAAHILHCYVTPTVSVATLSLPKVFRLAIRSSLVKIHQSKWATCCRCARFQWVRRFIVLR